MIAISTPGGLVGLLFIVAVGVILILWAARHLNGVTRCPTCGVDLEIYPHKPRCNYWRL